MKDLFIQYANTDFKDPLLSFNDLLEVVQNHNKKSLSDIDSFSINDHQVLPFDFRATEIFNRVTELINAPEGSFSALVEAFENRGAFYTSIKDREIGSHKNIRDWIAVEGVYFNIVNDCNGACRFNFYGERKPFIEGIEIEDIKCHQCDQIAFKHILDIIISGSDFYSLPEFKHLLRAKNKVAISKTLYIGKTGLKERSWIKPDLLYWWETPDIRDGQRFSRFIMGCVGFSLLSFIVDSPQNLKKIKKCRRCNEYFISSKADQRIKKCRACSGKRTTKENREKAQRDRKNKKDKEYRKIKLKIKKELALTPQKAYVLEKNGELDQLIKERLKEKRQQNRIISHSGKSSMWE